MQHRLYKAFSFPMLYGKVLISLFITFDFEVITFSYASLKPGNIFATVQRIRRMLSPFLDILRISCNTSILFSNCSLSYTRGFRFNFFSFFFFKKLWRKFFECQGIAVYISSASSRKRVPISQLLKVYLNTLRKPDFTALASCISVLAFRPNAVLAAGWLHFPHFTRQLRLINRSLR